MGSRKQGKRTSLRDFQQRVMGGGRCPDDGKVRFLSKTDAKRSAKRMKGRDGRLNAYACGEFWHIGHPPRDLVAGRIARDDIQLRRKA